MPIQPAGPDDLDAIRALLDACDLPSDDLTPAHLDHFLVVRDEEGLHGVVGLEPCGPVALLRSLAVAPDVRGEGLGGALTAAIEERARAETVHALYLFTTTAADYFRARGYEQIERDALPEPIRQTEEATRLCPASATGMRKTLRGAGQ